MLINLLSSQKLERKKWVEKLAAGGRRGPRKRESRKSDLPAGKAWRLLPVGKKKCWVLLLGPCHTYVVGIGRVIYSILTFLRILKTSNLLLLNSGWESLKKSHFHELASEASNHHFRHFSLWENETFLVIFKHCVTRTRNASFFMELLDDLHPQLSSFVFVSPGPDVKL